jgi:hypothetical protein
VERVPFKWAWSRFAVAFTPAFTSALLLGALFADVEGGTATLVLQRVTCLVLGVASAVLTVRIVRQGVFTDHHCVEIRNIFSTKRVAWSDIQRFEPPAAYGKVRKPGMLAVLKNGTTISASAVQRGRLEGPGGTDAVVAFMNRELDLRSGRQ